MLKLTNRLSVQRAADPPVGGHLLDSPLLAVMVIPTISVNQREMRDPMRVTGMILKSPRRIPATERLAMALI